MWQGLSSTDIDSARDAAQRSLVSTLPQGTRNLLYRLSITIGSFDRQLALTIGKISPAVFQAGECIDQLVGPWIEAIGRDLFRVSPLARSLGGKMLSFDEQERIHETISVQMLKKGTINAGDIDAILMHAMTGNSLGSLATLARGILSLDYRTLEMITEHLAIFHLLRTRRTDLPPRNLWFPECFGLRSLNW